MRGEIPEMQVWKHIFVKELYDRKANGVLCCRELTGYVCATAGVTMLLDLEKEKSYKKLL